MNEQSPLTIKKIPNEDDFNFSISNEHNEQELTSLGETGKSSGIISLMHFPHPNFSITNKNKLFIKQYDPNYNRDNFSVYTSMKKIKNDDSKINDEITSEVRNNLLNYKNKYTEVDSRYQTVKAERKAANKLQQNN